MDTLLIGCVAPLLWTAAAYWIGLQVGKGRLIVFRVVDNRQDRARAREGTLYGGSKGG